MTDLYILNNKTPIRCINFEAWGQWFCGITATKDRIVAQDTIGDCLISTVFIGIDHQWHDGGPPLLFETMVFDKGESIDCQLCSTWEEAEIQHKNTVKRVTEQHQ